MQKEPLTFYELGKLSAEARKNLAWHEKRRIARKGAARKKMRYPDTFVELGIAGAQKRHDISPDAESEIARKAAKTRKERDPESFIKMGRAGGIKSGIARNNKLLNRES